MPELVYVTLALSGLAACAAVIALVISLRRSPGGTISERGFADLLRAETERLRQSSEEQSRGLRQELGEGIRGFQETTLKSFQGLGEGVGDRISAFGERLDAGIKAIDERAAAIGLKLDHDIRQMGEDATLNRDGLRTVIEQKLDDAIGRQLTAGRELRQEVSESAARLQETLTASAGDQRAAQAEQFETFAVRLAESLTEINRRGEEVRATLTQSLAESVSASDTRHASLVATLDGKLADLITTSLKLSGDMREQVSTKFSELGTTTVETLNLIAQQQKERLGVMVSSIDQLSERHEAAQVALRQAVEGRLDAIRTENTAKLDEIRKTVDDQLQTTLNERITNSFKMVHDQLEQVYRGLGEMQKLAEGVGDLKRVLTNVKARGVFGEVQLGSLMEQMFSPDQYVENAQTRDHSQERVEFAVKIPGRSGEGEVLLPIDAKFPIEDFERIIKASERSDPAAIEAAAAQLEARIRASAKEMRDKYINPPRTTDFAILCLPIESLYAEVLRRPGVIESIQETHGVVIAGPTTLLAILNAFRMSIRAVAIQQRSTEVWQILGAVRSEFDKHGNVLGKLQRQLEASLSTVDTLGTRTRAMKRRLQGVDAIGADRIEDVLRLPALAEDTESGGLVDAAE